MSLINSTLIDLSDEVKQNISCSIVQNFDYAQRCEFVLSAADCSKNVKYINYVKLFFCDLSPESYLEQALYAILLLSFCWVLFLVLATTIDRVFCPALKVIALHMHMNEHLAGVTLVAFGGCSPDVISTLASISQGEQKGLYSDLVGSGLYVSIFISSLVIILAPFEMHSYSSIRDVAFLLFSMLYIDHALRSGDCISILESSLILSIYSLYLVVLTVDQIMLKHQVRRLQSRVSTGGIHASVANFEKLEKMRSQAQIEVYARVSRRSHSRVSRSRVSIDISQTRKSQFESEHAKNEDLFKQFVQSLSPYDSDAFEEAGTFSKTAMIIRAPINFVLFLFLPIIDYEMPQHGWTKLLNCIQMIVLPSLSVWVFNPHGVYFDVPLWALVLIFSAPLSFFFFAISRTDIPPKGHVVIAFFASVGSATVIYLCASEVMRIFYVIGVVSNSSAEFLGCTLLAWGMAIGDLISNVILATNGYPRMGYAACFGSPLFNNVLIVGGNFLIKCIQAGKFCVPVPRGVLDENVVCFMFLSLVFTLIWMLLTNCQARRSVGIFTLSIYIVFFIYSLLCELDIVHTLAEQPDFFPIL